MIIKSAVPARVAQIIEADLKFDGRTLRPEQKMLLPRMVNHAIMRWDNLPFAPLMLQEAGTGIGKTLIELVVAGLFALEGQRSVISVHTIALREQIRATMPMAQKLIDTAARMFRWKDVRPIVIDRLVSISQYISPAKMEDYTHWVDTSRNVTEREREEWTEFADFFNTQQSIGGRVEFHDWYEAAGGKPLPLSLNSLDLAVDEGSDPDFFKEVQAEQHGAFEADILVVTHTMLRLLTWKLRSYDHMEKTDKVIKHDCGEYAILIGDEAHNLPLITRSWIEKTVHIAGDALTTGSTIRDILEQSPLNADALMEPLADLEQHVRDQLGARREFHVDNPDTLHPLITKIEPLYLLLVDLYERADTEPVFQTKLENVLDSLVPFVALSAKSGVGDAFFRDLPDTDAYPILIRRGSLVSMKMKAGSLGRTISSIWRRNKDALNKRLFKTVIMLSGTLADAPKHGVLNLSDPYGHFRRDIGAFTASGAMRDVIWYGNPIPSTNVGHALRVVFSERSLDLLPMEEVGDDNYRVNPRHTDFIVRTLRHIFHHELRKGQPNRVLALFMSERALIDAYDLLVMLDPAMRDHIIAQRSGMRFVGSPLNQFRADPRSILLSMNWQGINATDEQERSLVNHLVLTKVPLMPRDERRARQFPLSSMRMLLTEAHWLFRQGGGRAARDSTARYTLWLGDVRIPLPDELVPPYAKYTRETSEFMREFYENFEAISLILFGKKSRTGLLAGTVRLGYACRKGDGLVVTDHDVMVSPRAQDHLLTS